MILTFLFHDLSGISEAAENPYGEDDSKSPFPVQPQVKRSYAQNVTVWIKASGLQVQSNHCIKAQLLTKVFGEMMVDWGNFYKVFFRICAPKVHMPWYFRETGGTVSLNAVQLGPLCEFFLSLPSMPYNVKVAQDCFIEKYS